MFPRSYREMELQDNNSDFAVFLRNITEHRANFPQFVDSKNLVVLPRVAKEYGFKQSNNIITIENESFYAGTFSALTISDEVTKEICHFDGCTFGPAHFADSVYENVRMNDCTFYGANFRTSNFKNAYIEWVGAFYRINLDDADFTNATFFAKKQTDLGINFDSVSLRRTSLRNAVMLANGYNHGMYAASIYRSTFDSTDCTNLSMKEFDFLANTFINLQLINVSIDGGDSSSLINPFGAYFYRNKFERVNLTDSKLARCLFSKNTFSEVVFNRVDLSKTLWDLGEKSASYAVIPSTANIFNQTSLTDVNATSAVLIPDEYDFFGRRDTNLNDVSGLQGCSRDLIDYFKENNVSISGKSTFGTPDNSFTCSTGIRFAAIGVPIILFALAACSLLYAKRYGCDLKKPKLNKLRLFKMPNDGDLQVNTPLLPMTRP